MAQNQDKTVDLDRACEIHRLMVESGDKAVEEKLGTEAKCSPEH